jgi:hypothetical protein
LPLVAIRQFVSLPVNNVIHRFGNTTFIPKFSPAAFFRPRSVHAIPKPFFAEPLGSSRFQVRKSPRRIFSADTNNSVNVIRTNVYRQHSPVPFVADLANTLLDGFSLPGIQFDRRAL